jgi:hypothetical protein
MPRTNHRSQNTFTIPHQGSVTLPPLPSLPSTSSSSPPNLSSSTQNHNVYITFPIASKIATGLHWHETHTEYLQIIQGCVLVTLGDTTNKYTADSGVITIPRFMVREYRRADSVPSTSRGKAKADDEEGEDEKDVDLIVKEWTSPGDGEKPLFFRNVVGIILDRDPNAGLLAKLWMAWGLMVVFWEWDNFPRFVKMPKLGELGRVLERGMS